MTERYVELHAASAFSFLEGASQPEALIERAVALEIPAMALLDRNGVYGSARFHTSAKRNALRAHVGAEIAVSSFGQRLTPPAWLPHQYESEPARLPLLCESREGYQNLCQLVTRFKMRETIKQEGAANFGDLQQYASGLVCLTGGNEGPLAAALMRGGENAGRETVERLVRIFGAKNVYVEVQRHLEREQEWRNQAAIRIARSLNLSVLATNGVRYASAYDRKAVGMRRSWERMKSLEGKLRAGMTANGLDTATQENIIQNISSFALYGFPESHAASFALIAYASRVSDTALRQKRIRRDSQGEIQTLSSSLRRAMREVAEMALKHTKTGGARYRPMISAALLSNSVTLPLESVSHK